MIWLDVVTAAAGMATAGSIVFAALQVRQTAAGIRSTERQEQAAFELRFSDRYDRCISQIPLRVLLDQDDYDPTDEVSRRGFYDYFELCEQECYYKPRISASTWNDWCDGINTNSTKESFQAAWAELSSVAETQFDEFKRCFPALRDQPGSGSVSRDWVSLARAAAGEQDPQPVVVQVAEPSA